MLNLTASEFKAWFDGFSQGINGVPTKEQWELIKKKVEEISFNYNYFNAPLYTREPNPPMPYPVITCSSLISSLD